MVQMIKVNERKIKEKLKMNIKRILYKIRINNKKKKKIIKVVQIRRKNKKVGYLIYLIILRVCKSRNYGSIYKRGIFECS